MVRIRSAAGLLGTAAGIGDVSEPGDADAPRRVAEIVFARCNFLGLLLIE